MKKLVLIIIAVMLFNVAQSQNPHRAKSPYQWRKVKSSAGMIYRKQKKRISKKMLFKDPYKFKRVRSNHGMVYREQRKRIKKQHRIYARKNILTGK